jgi:hypothetical protein
MTSYYSWHAKQLDNYNYFVIIIKDILTNWKKFLEIVQGTIQYIFRAYLKLKETFWKGEGGKRKSIIKLHGYMDYDE